MIVIRKMLLRSISFAVAVCLLMVCTTATADWPQFQGVNRDGRSLEQGISRTWPEKGPRVLWSIPLGAGFASPAVVDGEVYVLDRVDDKKDVLRCVDLTTGKELWTYAYDAPGRVGQNGSRGTPTVDADYVYSVGMLGNMTCVDRKTHELVWKKHLLKEFDAEIAEWGVAQNPVLYGDRVIVAPQGPDASVVAFDRETGAEVWRSEGLGGVGFCSPAVVTLGAVEQVVMIAASIGKEEDEGPPGKVAGLSLEDGTVLWSYEGWSCRIPITFPKQLPGDRLFVTGGYGAGSVMLQVTRDGDAFAVKELFRLDMKECGSQIHQPILHENHLYLNSNSNEREDGMLCVTLDGKVLWRTADTDGLPTFERGNLLFADGLIIGLHGKRGTLHLVEPSPEGYKELAKAKLFSGRQMWGPMALSQGKLLVRNQKELKCVDLRNP
jgi:outer membrane protein assembly factor BamB